MSFFWPSFGDLVLKVPTHHPTLQAAFDAAKGRVRVNRKVTILIESGFEPEAGVLLENGDWSHFEIASEDAEVSLASTFATSGWVLRCRNARAPVFNILVDGCGRGGGVRLEQASSVTIRPGKGVKNTWSTGLLVLDGSHASARETIWTGAAHNAATGAGITVWGAHADCEGADVSGSHYYGAQAAHGGVLNFRLGKANSCKRYGVRATDAGYMDFDGGEAKSCRSIGIYAFNGSHINARNATATGCGADGGGNVSASNGSSINGREGTFGPGGKDYGTWASGGSSICAISAFCRRLTSNSNLDIRVTSGSQITAGSSTGGTSVSVNTLSASGIIFK